ncbi:MAG: hypothetical protein ACD_73C00001G0002 [uncultured bacterium]|nr:MAG: hypothetical protein ACD_73C00001G0002 [uncultured bacterium]
MDMNQKKFFRAIQEASSFLKYLSHPLRLKILCLLSQKSLTVMELQDMSGGSQAQISQFLAKMRSGGLVSFNKDGNFVRYQIKDLKVKKIILSLEKIFCP